MKVSHVAISLLALSVAAPSAMAQAIISFGAPTAITTADAALNLPGTIVGAAQFAFGAPTVTVTTSTQTIPFGGGGGLLNFTSVYAYTDQGTSQFTGSGNANFDLAMSGFAYNFGGNPVLAQLINLTPGDAYQVQFFGIDARAGASTRTLQYSDGLGDSSTDVTQGDGDYVIGSFVASGTTENFAVTGPEAAVLNALVLRDTTPTSATPEPGSMALLAGMLFGGACFAKRRRARKK